MWSLICTLLLKLERELEEGMIGISMHIEAGEKRTKGEQDRKGIMKDIKGRRRRKSKVGGCIRVRGRGSTTRQDRWLMSVVEHKTSSHMSEVLICWVCTWLGYRWPAGVLENSSASMWERTNYITLNNRRYCPKLMVCHKVLSCMFFS